MMDFKKIALYGVLVAIVYGLWINWEKDYPNTNVNSTTPSAIIQKTPNATLPELNQANPTTHQTSTVTPEASHISTSAKVISVKTDVLDVAIDLANGNLVGAKLLKYPVSLAAKNQPFVLLNQDPLTKYVANSDLLITDNGALTPVNLEFTTDQEAYSLQSDQDNLVVKLTGANNQGLQVTKSYTFKRGEYLVEVKYDLHNTASQPWVGYFNTQLLRANPQQDQSSMFHVGSYTGASISIPKVKPYKKISYADMKKSSVNQDVTGGWVAMQEHYFLSSWIPNPTTNNKIYSRVVDNQYVIGMLTNSINVAPQQSLVIGSRLYIGPELTDVLKGIAPGLDLTVDYGWLWFISMFIFWVMKNIYHYVGNWGWSIVIVTLLIKLVFYRLSAASFKSMANMRKLQPKLQSLKERFGDDKAKLSQATMELYRKEKINPLGGCLPIVVQIPVFIGLYWVLLESVQLRQSPFILWIHDLSASDPYYVLPILMGITMVIQQRLNPAPPDPMQAKMMMLLPIVFTALFLHFPAGLVLYWTVNNGLTILQQWYITRKYADKTTTSKEVTKKAVT